MDFYNSKYSFVAKFSNARRELDLYSFIRIIGNGHKW